MEKNENVTEKVNPKSVPESKIQIIVTDHETDTCVLDHGQENGEKEAEVNPWVATRTFPASWICTVLILGIYFKKKNVNNKMKENYHDVYFYLQ